MKEETVVAITDSDADEFQKQCKELQGIGWRVIPKTIKVAGLTGDGRRYGCFSFIAFFEREPPPTTPESENYFDE